MVEVFSIANETLDSLDLKFLLLAHGVHIHEDVYAGFSSTHRISPDPYQCNGLILPDQTVVHIADIGPGARFHLAVRPDGNLQLLHQGESVTEVSLPKASDFYSRTTAGGVPFRGLAVLEGHDMLAFPYLWACGYAFGDMACKFCHCGIYTQARRDAGDGQWNHSFKPDDVAEAVERAVRVEGAAKHIELTGGSTFGADGECRQMTEVLHAIDRKVGRTNIPGSINVYTTPPMNPSAVDALFDAGADRVSCNIEVWDESIAGRVMPGKSRWTGRQRHLDTLLHIAQKRGAGKACCTFVAGLEPAESLLAGARQLAENGIVPLASVLMPHGLPDIPRAVKPDLPYFRALKRGLAAIYRKYQCEPPGGGGSHVAISRDVWNHRDEILAAC